VLALRGCRCAAGESKLVHRTDAQEQLHADDKPRGLARYKQQRGAGEMNRLQEIVLAAAIAAGFYMFVVVVFSFGE